MSILRSAGDTLTFCSSAWTRPTVAWKWQLNWTSIRRPLVLRRSKTFGHHASQNDLLYSDSLYWLCWLNWLNWEKGKDGRQRRILTKGPPYSEGLLYWVLSEEPRYTRYVAGSSDVHRLTITWFVLVGDSQYRSYKGRGKNVFCVSIPAGAQSVDRAYIAVESGIEKSKLQDRFNLWNWDLSSISGVLSQ